MQIALFSTIYPFRGGIAQFSAALYKALLKQNPTVAYTFSKQYPDFLFPGSSQYITADDCAEQIPSVPVLNSVNPLSYYTAAKAIRKQAPAVFISNYWLPFFAPSVGTMARFLPKNTKKIALLHNVIPHEKRAFDKQLSQYFVNQHDGFICLSEAVKNDLHSLKPGAPVVVKHHPLYDHFGALHPKQEAIEKLKLPSNKKLLLYFGYIRDYKGLDLLISALAQLPPDYHLILAGECYGDFSKYTQQIENEGVADKISLFTRYIPDEEVSLLFSAADVVVLPYKTATQSGVTAIALHFEKPLIVTNVGGLKELLVDGETGLLVQEPSVDLLVEQITNFYTNHSGTDFSGNIKHLKQSLSWDKFAEEVLLFANSL